MISDDELQVLSYYRAGELAGSVLFGRLALHCEIDDVRVPLTRHCMEEAEHAWLWTKTIKELGHVPLKVTDVYQTEYAREFGMPQNTLEIFALTQTLETRVVEHFQYHLSLPGQHPVVAQTLQKMIDDETGHLSWIKQRLAAYQAQQGSTDIDALMERLSKIDQQAHHRVISNPAHQRYFRSFGGG